MNGKESKRSKARRKLYSAPTNGPSVAPTWPPSTTFSSSTTTPFQPFGSGVTMNVNDVATEFGLNLKSENSDAERITELMDAPVDLDIAAHAISRGPNPYLDRCMHCNALRPDTQEGDEGLELLDLQLDGNTVITSGDSQQPFSSFKLEIWTCSDCRKVAKNFQSYLAYDLPFVSDKEIVNPLSFTKPTEEKDNNGIEEVQDNWAELRSIIRDLYAFEEEPMLNPEQEQRLQFLIDKLCRIDPHQLFLGLEAQVREIVTDIKTGLVMKLKEKGCDKPELALDFTSCLLLHYDLLTKKAHLLAQYLSGLSSHLERFGVTWELLNKHLFHSIAHNDPAISSSGPNILEQLRQGSMQCEKSKDDPYCAVRKRLLKFQDEMSVVVVVWRDCQQLIENYCHEEVKNTHKHVSSKTRSFISQQRQLLKDHLLREPYSGEALTETMRNLMAGHKSSRDRVMCHRCKRERCTCDECTITHRITCGIINSDLSSDHPPNAFNFALDHTRNVMDITPPSMSSTTSSSGSVSPINIEDKLTTFYEHSTEEFSDALLNCEEREGKAIDLNGDDDEADDEDEGDEDEYGDVQDAGGDEPHSLQDPAFLWEAMQEHQREQMRQQVYLERRNHCSHRHSGKSDQVCPFQPPINPKLSRELDAELAKSGLLPKGGGDYVSSDLNGSLEVGAESKGGGGGSGDNNGGIMNSPLCAACQCHACLKQSGHVVSTTLPLQVTASPSPADLHLYPHIHGLPQQEPKSLMFDLPHLMSSIKLPVKIDFDDPAGLQDHFYNTYSSDWDSPMQPRPGSLAAQHQHQHHQRLSAHTSDLLPPPPLESASSPFIDLASHLATHTTHTSTTNTTSAFKAVSGKHLATPFMPGLSNMGTIHTEGSSVDPSKPLDFSSLSKIPQSCLNGNGVFPNVSFPPSPTFSCVTNSFSTSVPVTSATSNTTMSKGNGTCQGPPCSRPTPLGGNVSSTSSKWEKGGHSLQCKKFPGGNAGGASPSGKQQIHLAPGSSGQPHQHPLSTKLNPGTGTGQAFSAAALKNLFPSPQQQQQPQRDVVRSKSSPQVAPACTTVAHTPRSSGLSSPANSDPSSHSPNLATVVNNIGVGTATAPCADPHCEVHHGEENCDSVDDSCSEKSSSTTTSNQKEGKYCDCCYCEFFGHNNATTAKTSTNYIETKDRLRKILKKRQTEVKPKSASGKNGIKQDICNDDEHDLLDKKGLEGLLRFINGTDESGSKGKEKELSAKAAKRARQKQKKLEEKARIMGICKNMHEELNSSQTFLTQSSTATNQLDPDSLSNMANSNCKKQSAVIQNDEIVKVKHEDAILKQEINRKSLIIEATRPTISLSKKDADKRYSPAQASCIAAEKDLSQNHVLGSLQNKNKGTTSPLSSNTPNSPKSQAKAINGIPHKSFVSGKSSKENKISGATSQSVGREKESSLGACQQQQPNRTTNHQQQKAHPSTKQGQQQKQIAPKVVNGRSAGQGQHVNSRSGVMPRSSTNSTTSNGKTNSSLLSATNGSSHEGQHLVNGHCELNGNKTWSSTDTAAFAPPAIPTAKGSSLVDSPGTGSGSSASQSPSCGSKASSEQGRAVVGKTKKKKKNKSNGINCVDEIFMPKSESELDADVDDFERELEEFKRFCFEPAEPREKRKIAVNVNLKDIFKKKTGLV